MRPARDAVLILEKLENDIISDGVGPFLKDLEDLVTHASEAIDTYREMLSDQLNIYHSSVSNRMNDVMKVLTIFAAIFIPLTFIASIYGMNFTNMPELHTSGGYFVVLGAMAVLALGMVMWFRRRGWL